MTSKRVLKSNISTTRTTIAPSSSSWLNNKIYPSLIESLLFIACLILFPSNKINKWLNPIEWYWSTTGERTTYLSILFYLLLFIYLFLISFTSKQQFQTQSINLNLKINKWTLSTVSEFSIHSFIHSSLSIRLESSRSLLTSYHNNLLSLSVSLAIALSE